MAKASSAKPTAPAGQAAPVFSLKVTLQGTKLPIWRRILVPGGFTLADLHGAIQSAMGWHDSHLHAFDVGGQHYGHKDSGDDMADEARITLAQLHASGFDRFTYNYDFGDDWDHLIVIEKTVPATEGAVYPSCVAGKRRCPPEDCGGVWGYQQLLEVLADPANPARAEQIAWLGGPFDPEAFSITAANAHLAARFRRRTRTR